MTDPTRAGCSRGSPRTTGIPDDGVDTQVTTFRYENGVYDRLEREFYGYGRVIEEDRDAANGDALYRSTVREYRDRQLLHPGPADPGAAPGRAGRPFVETEQHVQPRRRRDGLPAADPKSTTATVFPQHVRIDRRFYEGQAAPGKTTYTEQGYDALGNMTRMFDAGEAGPQDDLEVDDRVLGLRRRRTSSVSRTRSRPSGNGA